MTNEYVIISFKSRNKLFEFAKILRSVGVMGKIINTPREISSSCGVSLQVEGRLLPRIYSAIRTSSIGGLIGIFVVHQDGFMKNYQRLY